MPSSLICDTFVENSWRRDLCSNCFRCEAEHEITMIRTTNPRTTSSAASPRIGASSRDFRSDLHLSLMSSSLTLASSKLSTQATSKQSSTVKSILKGGPDPSKKKGVVFKDEEQVIGFGGLDSVPEDEDDDDDGWDVSEEDFDEALLDSLDTTEQDKMFTKLTKKNTDFNSINANLVKDTKTPQKDETKVDHSMKLSTTTNSDQSRSDHRIDLDLTRSVTEELDKRLQMMQRNKNVSKEEFNYLDVPCKDVLTADDLSLTRDLLIEDTKGDSIDSGAPSSRESSSSPDSFSLKGSERGSSSPDSTRSSKSSAYESIYDSVETTKPQTNHISTVMVNNNNNASVNNEVNEKNNKDTGRNSNSMHQTEIMAFSIGERGPGRQPVRRASHRVVLRTDSDAVIASNNATTIQIEGQPRGVQLKSSAQSKVSSQTLKISEFALGGPGLQPARSDPNLLEGKTALKTVPSSVPSFNAPICRSAVSELHLDRVSQKNIPGNNSRQVKCLSAANIEQSYADQRSAEKYGTLRRTSRLYEDPKYLAFASKAKPVQPPVVPSIRKDIYGTYRAAKKYTAPKIPVELEQEPIYAEPIEHVAKSQQQQSNMDGEKKPAQTENIYQEIRGTSTLSRKERQLAELAMELEKARYNSVPNRRSAPVLSEYSGQWDPVARQFQKPLPPGAQAGGSRKTRQAPAIPRAASTGGGSISRAGLFNLKKLLKRGNSGKEEERKTWKAELQISQPRPIHRPEILHPSDLERLGESVIYQTPRLNSTKVERFGSILHGTSEAQFQPLMSMETAPPPPPMRQRPIRDNEPEVSRSPSDAVVRQQPKVPKRRVRLDYANMGKSEESDSTTSALQPLASNLWSSPAKLLESLQEINHQELVGFLNHVSTCSHGLPVPENIGSNQGSGTLTSASCNGGIAWSDLRLTSERVPKGEDLQICKAVYNPTNAKLTLLFTPPKSLPLSHFLLERTVVASNGLQSGHTVLILPQSQIRTLKEFSSHCDERSALYIMLQLCRDLQSLQAQGVASLVPSEQQVLVASWDQLAYLLLMYKKSPKNASIQQQPLHIFALSILSELQAPEKRDPLLNLIADLLKRNDFDMCKRVIEFELWQAPRDPMANGVPGEDVRDAFGRWLALQKALAVQRNCSSQLRHSPTAHKQAIPCSVFLEYQLQFLASATGDGLAATLEVIKNVSAAPTQDSNPSEDVEAEELYADYRYC